MPDIMIEPKLFLVPVGPENEHQQTIDGRSPIGPCWGLTDGNNLVKGCGSGPGDLCLFIRARSKFAAATVYRLGVIERLFRDPELAGQLYKIQHHYSMGGKQKQDVPFTWIVKLKQVVCVNWDKQNFAQAKQIFQYCQQLLASPSICHATLEHFLAAMQLQPTQLCSTSNMTAHNTALHSPQVTDKSCTDVEGSVASIVDKTLYTAHKVPGFTSFGHTTAPLPDKAQVCNQVSSTSRDVEVWISDNTSSSGHDDTESEQDFEVNSLQTMCQPWQQTSRLHGAVMPSNVMLEMTRYFASQHGPKWLGGMCIQ